MYRNLFFIVLMLCISMAGFSQTKKQNADPKELAKAAVQNKHKVLMDRMKLKLISFDKSNKLGNELKDIDRAKEQQFLYEENLIDSLLRKKKGRLLKSHTLRDVIKALCEEPNMPTTLISEGSEIGNISVGKGKKGQLDSNVLIVPVSFQTHSVAKNNQSNVKHNVTFEYRVKLKEKKVKDEKTKKRITTIVVDGEPVLISSIVGNPIMFLDSEVSAMYDAAKDTIIGWYAHLPETLKSEYAVQAKGDIHACDIKDKDINIYSREGRTIIVKNVKDIEFGIEPQLEYDEMYYKDPTASMRFSPSFKIVVADDFKTVNSMEVLYGEPIIKTPVTEREKLMRRDQADNVINAFGKSLSAYVTSNEKERKSEIIEMFEAADNNVQVSHRYKNGKEKIDSKTAEKYLNRLKGTDLAFVDCKMIDQAMANEMNEKYPELGLVFDSNLYTVMYLVHQKYEGRAYEDSTDKIVILNYNDTNKEYLVSKIVVIPNSTTIE